MDTMKYNKKDIEIHRIRIMKTTLMENKTGEREREFSAA